MRENIARTEQRVFERIINGKQIFFLSTRHPQPCGKSD